MPTPAKLPKFTLCLLSYENQKQNYAHHDESSQSRGDHDFNAPDFTRTRWRFLTSTYIRRSRKLQAMTNASPEVCELSLLLATKSFCRRATLGVIVATDSQSRD